MHDKHLMAPSVRHTLDEMQVVQRMERLEELAERVIRNQSDIVELVRANTVNGVLFSGMVATDANSVFRLDFVVPYAGFAIANNAGATLYVSNFTNDRAISPQGGQPINGLHTITPTSLGRVIHLAGILFNVVSSAANQQFGLTIYSNPNLFNPQV